MTPCSACLPPYAIEDWTSGPVCMQSCQRCPYEHYMCFLPLRVIIFPCIVLACFRCSSHPTSSNHSSCPCSLCPHSPSSYMNSLSSGHLPCHPSPCCSHLLWSCSPSSLEASHSSDCSSQSPSFSHLPHLCSPTHSSCNSGCLSHSCSCCWSLKSYSSDHSLRQCSLTSVHILSHIYTYHS